jgi:Lrp/AsnC family transcriptional regulator, leucine-responsive regulatory protein
MDDRDLKLLELLQRDARTTIADLSRALGIAASAVHERIRKLERRGIVRGYTARVDPVALGQSLLAFIFVQADERPGGEDLGEVLAAVPEVQEVHHIAGEDCYLIKVRCASTTALGELLKERLGPLPEVRRTRTIVVLGTVKEDSTLKIPASVGEAGRDPD